MLVYKIPGHPAAMLIFIPLEFAISWVAGFALRERVEQAEAAEVRASQAERERDAAARLAVAEERVRIARELHDIVAHAVSVMVLQVGAVRHKLPDALAEDSDALRGVEQVGRTALAEMRGLLAAMRRDGEEAELIPQPGLDGLDALLEEIGRAGLPVQLHVDGEPAALPRGIDLSAYRIVQEGLTNALKHARASNAEVTVRYRPDELHIEVRDDGEGSSTSNGLGHGLVGVRERVKIYGGQMSAGSANGSGFILSTRLPLRAGPSGFVLKDDPPEQLLAAVRTVADGEALLSPAITKRVIRQFTRIPQPAPPKQLDELTERELDVFRLIARGLSNAEIGAELYISDTTVKTHITHILQKLDLRDRVQAVVLAYETGLFDTDARPPSTRDARPLAERIPQDARSRPS